MRPKTIYLIDDDDAVLTSIERLLKLEGFSVRTFSSAEAFLKRYEGSMRGCVVCDVRMPAGMTGVEMLASLRKLKSCLPVIFLTGFSDVPVAVKAMKSGAANFLLKPARIPELPSAIRESLALEFPDESATEGYENVEYLSRRLSVRENEVIDLVVAGESNKMIAALLGISPRTVEVHRANGMRRLGANTLHGLMMAVNAANVGASE